MQGISGLSGRKTHKKRVFGMKDDKIKDVKHCEWCESPIKKDQEVTHAFLTGFFGYVYCSKECRDEHAESK
jgi:hypothetical protein